MATAELQTDGAVIEYDDGGHGESLVLVHGSWVDRQSWALVQPGFEKSFRTIAYSRRGHGQSTGDGSLDTDVADLAALIEQLDAAPVHLAGNSMGATICLRLALSRPDLLASVSAHEPPIFGLLAGDTQWEPGLDDVNRRVGAVLELIERGHTREAAERFVEDVALGPGAWEALRPREREMFIRHAGTFAEERADSTIYGIDPQSLSSVTIPVLLTAGGASPPLFAPVLERLAAILPRTEQHRFPDAGHIPHATHPDEYLQTVTDFVARVGRPHNAVSASGA